MIKTAGYLVSPHEVEHILMEHKGVSEVAVVGVPDTMQYKNEISTNKQT